MQTADFDYDLPEELIAQSPANPRDHSRLLVVNRKSEELIGNHFYDIVEYLTDNDVLVMNNTKVFPARFFCKKDSGGKLEVLLIEEVEKNIWKALTKPGLKDGQTVLFSGTTFTCVGHEEQTALLKSSADKEKLLISLQESGITPLPPYIKSSESEEKLRKEYQTVYAKITGSVAAPTAGFHFTPYLLEKIKQKGVQIEYVTLHVGLGTFAPVKTEKLEDHPMHFENFEVDKNTLKRLNEAKSAKKRIIAVGTTTTRVLETLTNENGNLNMERANGSTNLFIYPPYKFKFINALITNFHLPKSTLLSLVSAFVSYPNTNTKFKNFKECLAGSAYQKAVREKYRFYSFGDAMFIF